MRAKFQTDSVTDFAYGNREVNLSAVVSGNKEDNDFNTATPYGKLVMGLSKDAGGFNFLKPGKKYILTFEEAQD